jgi:hypothetical protein
MHVTTSKANALVETNAAVEHKRPTDSTSVAMRAETGRASSLLRTKRGALSVVSRYMLTATRPRTQHKTR